MKGLHPHSHVTLWYRGHVTKKETLYLHSYLAGWWLRMRDPTNKVTWFFDISVTWQNKKRYISKLRGWWLRMREPHPQSHVIHRPLGHVTTQRRYISTFIRPMDPKLSRTLVSPWLLRYRFAQKEIGWFKHRLVSILLCQKSIIYLMLKKPLGCNGKLVLAENKRKKNAN